ELQGRRERLVHERAEIEHETRRLERVVDVEDARLCPFFEHFCQRWRNELNHLLRPAQAQTQVLVPKEHVDERTKRRRMFFSEPLPFSKEELQFLKRPEVLSLDDRRQRSEPLLSHAPDQRLEHILLRSEVMIESALRDANGVEEIVHGGGGVASAEE